MQSMSCIFKNVSLVETNCYAKIVNKGKMAEEKKKWSVLGVDLEVNMLRGLRLCQQSSLISLLPCCQTQVLLLRGVT